MITIIYNQKGILWNEVSVPLPLYHCYVLSHISSGVISVNHWGGSVYATYCFCSSNALSKVRFTQEKITNPWESLGVHRSPNPSPQKYICNALAR